jgi:hypothetical protein
MLSKQGLFRVAGRARKKLPLEGWGPLNKGCERRISGRFEEFWDFFASPKELPVSRTREGFNKGRECTELQERRDCLRNACAAGRIL